MENNKLLKKELSELEKDILSIIETSSISSAKEIANMLDIKESKVIEILNNDDFYNLICANSLSNMRLAYHSKGIPHLIKNLDNDKDFYDSYDRLTKAIGAVKERDNESLKVSLEVLLKDKTHERSEKNITHISSYTKGDTDLNSVSKSSGNIFAIEDSNIKPVVSHSTAKPEIEFDFEDE